MLTVHYVQSLYTYEERAWSLMPLVAPNPSPLTKPTRFPNKQASQTLNSHALENQRTTLP